MKAKIKGISPKERPQEARDLAEGCDTPLQDSDDMDGVIPLDWLGIRTKISFLGVSDCHGYLMGVDASIVLNKMPRKWECTIIISPQIKQ
jgi:hypothetical protein